jgi:cation diffusion facilitator CzcD-associated flavoprotein CzcO
MTDSRTPTDFDAIVIGTGFGGIYMLHKLRNELGLKVRAFDRAGGVGGTWYWNRYPGALSDVEGAVYCYSFDKELWRDTVSNARYVTQPQALAYLEHVVERYGLSSDIQLNTSITSATFDEAREVWEVQTDAGDRFSTKYLVTALGLLSATNVPDFKGLDSFAGDVYHTGALAESHDFGGQRVGVIGTGSSGVQVITAIAPVVDKLTVFQRSPQYTVPIGNDPLSDDELAALRDNYDGLWAVVHNSNLGFTFEESTIPAMSVSEEERRRVFQEAWDSGGGFRFMFGTFSDIATDPDANEAAAAFIRSKIAEIVTDPETAERLTPLDLYAKRPLCDSGYYETFNRPNVALVDIKANPIAEITPRGVRTEDGVEHELDTLVFATGFDAVDGNYTRMDICGRSGKAIKDHWESGPTSYVGVSTHGFPNMFMVLGPHSPFTNLPPAIETQVEWIADLIKHAEASELTTIEVTPEAEHGWVDTCAHIAGYTLFPKADSWIFGANIPGKPKTVMFYLSGLKAYREMVAGIATNNYEGFVLRTSEHAV